MSVTASRIVTASAALTIVALLAAACWAADDNAQSNASQEIEVKQADPAPQAPATNPAADLTAKPKPDAAAEKTEKPETKVETMPEGCVRELLTVPSPSMKRDIRVAVVTPPEYATKSDARYPVLYALHGMGASYKTFTDMPPLRQFMVDHPMILVCLDGDRDGCYVDATERPQSLFTTFFFDELLPWIDQHYRTAGRPAVTGFSMGGYGAFHYLLAHPERFSSASSLSGAFFLFGPDKDGRNHRSQLLGDPEKNRDAYAAAAVYPRVQKYLDEGTHLPPMLIACSTEDHLLAGNRDFINFLIARNAEVRKQRLDPILKDIADEMDKRRKAAELTARYLVDFRYIESPGAHNWVYWKGMSRTIAQFHWEQFQQEAKTK